MSRPFETKRWSPGPDYLGWDFWIFAVLIMGASLVAPILCLISCMTGRL